MEREYQEKRGKESEGKRKVSLVEGKEGQGRKEVEAKEGQTRKGKGGNGQENLALLVRGASMPSRQVIGNSTT